MDRVSVKLSVMSCTSCSLHSACNGPVPFRGPTPAKLAIVAEAPGKVEDEKKQPLVGPSGVKLQEWLDRAKIDTDVAYLNAVSCYPNRTPTAKEVEICRRNLHDQLAVIQPEFLLVLGGIALSSFWSSLRMGDARGRWWKASVPGVPQGIWSLSSYHPAAVLRNSSLDGVVIADLMKMKIALALGKPPSRHPDYRCVMCGGLIDVLRLHDNTDVTDSLDCEGSLGWCSKHDGLRMGTAGKGREKPKTASTKSTRGSASSGTSRRKNAGSSTKRSTKSTEVSSEQASWLDKYRVK